MNTRLAFLALLAVLAASEAQAAETGVRVLDIAVAHRQKPLQTYVFYPALPDGQTTAVGANPLFEGVDMGQDATPEIGRHPLVLLSHGSGGNAANLAWLGKALAAVGFVVAAPNHPGSTSADSRPADTVRLWERPQDLSGVLDAVLASPVLSAMVDPADISVAGFSLGGFSALASVGARMSAADYAAYCDRDWPDRPLITECNWLKASVDLHKLDARFEQSMLDSRYRRAVAIDPGLVHAATAESLSAIAVPVPIVSLGSPEQLPPAVATERVIALLPDAHQDYIPGAIHFSFLGECRPNGHAILIAENEPEPLCDDRGTPRSVLHEQIAAKVTAGLRR